ncbi:MAG: flavin reductase family protein [Pseudomonadota bacterium]
MLDDTWDGTADLRRAFSRFGTGVTVVTCTSPALGPLGFTANSFSSVSLTPPLILWSIGRDAVRHDPFAEAQDFAIHILADDQQDLAEHFVRNGGDFDQFDWHDAGGVPYLEGCLARLACTRHEAVAAGDHTILIGRVTAIAQREGVGLAYMNSAYGTMACDADGRRIERGISPKGDARTGAAKE